MLDQEAGAAEAKGLWAQTAADGTVAAGLPTLPAGEAEEGAALPSPAHAPQQHHGQRWQQQVTGGGAPFLSVSGSNNVIIITGLAAQHLVTHQPVQLETMSGREAASLAEHVAGIAQAQQEGAGHDQPAGGQGAAGATAGAHWQAWRDRRLAAAQTAAAGKRKSPEPGLAEEEEEAPAAKATRTGGGRGGRGKAAAP